MLLIQPIEGYVSKAGFTQKIKRLVFCSAHNKWWSQAESFNLCCAEQSLKKSMEDSN